MNPPRNVAILIFADVEVLDFCGPLEVFSVASRQVEPPAFDVFTVAETRDPVTCRQGLTVTPNFDFASCPSADLLLIPGGIGTRPLLDDEALLGWIQQAADGAELVLSVCTGALLLGKLGLLDGLEATTHHGSLELLRQIAPEARVHSDRRFVDNGKVIVSGGIAAGIDMSFHVVRRLLGADVAEATARHMEYPLSLGEYAS